MYLIGIDYGTGGGKAALVNDQGSIAAYAFEEYEIFTERPGWSEHDAQNYWSLAGRLINKVLKDAAVSPEEVAGVAVSSALPSMVMVDKEGEPLSRAYNLMDRRATAQVQRVKEEIGDKRVFEITKNRLDDHPALVNVLWEKENRPEIYRKIHKVLTIDGFVTYKLTGVYSCHFSGAAFYGVAYDLIKQQFNTEILNKLDLDASILPGLYRCEDIVGTITSEAARHTGLREGTPVAAGQVDCNAGWSGAGAIHVGDIQMNLGTCGNFGIIHSEPVFHDSMIAFNYTTDSNNTYITVPTTTTGGQLIRYLRDNFYTAEYKQAHQTGEDVFELINHEAEKVSAGSEGLLMLPYLMGERTPIWDVYARGVLFGLSLHHTRGHVARAAMEAVAFALYDSFSIIRETGIQINSPLVLNEGGAKSTLWRSIITDVFNIPTVMVKNRVGAPYGDAILAGVATGVFKDFSIAAEKAEYVQPMEPDQKQHEIYAEYFKLYKRLYAHLKQDFKPLAELREKTTEN